MENTTAENSATQADAHKQNMALRDAAHAYAAKMQENYSSLGHVVYDRAFDLAMAAPKMLKALEAALIALGRLGGNSEYHGDDPLNKMSFGIAREGWLKVRAAIAEAEGRS